MEDLALFKVTFVVKIELENTHERCVVNLKSERKPFFLLNQFPSVYHRMIDRISLLETPAQTFRDWKLLVFSRPRIMFSVNLIHAQQSIKKIFRVFALIETLFISFSSRCCRHSLLLAFLSFSPFSPSYKLILIYLFVNERARNHQATSFIGAMQR